jgi:hypothetical protein
MTTRNWLQASKTSLSLMSVLCLGMMSGCAASPPKSFVELCDQRSGLVFSEKITANSILLENGRNGCAGLCEALLREGYAFIEVDVTSIQEGLYVRIDVDQIGLHRFWLAAQNDPACHRKERANDRSITRIGSRCLATEAVNRSKAQYIFKQSHKRTDTREAVITEMQDQLIQADSQKAAAERVTFVYVPKPIPNSTHFVCRNIPPSILTSVVTPR